jgi:hypothetical protein
MKARAPPPRARRSEREPRAPISYPRPNDVRRRETLARLRPGAAANELHPLRTRPLPRGVLKVRVVSACDLRNKHGTWGALNPYCKVGGARPAGAHCVAVQLSVAVLHDALHDALHGVLRFSYRSPCMTRCMTRCMMCCGSALGRGRRRRRSLCHRGRGERAKSHGGSRGRRFGVE